MDARVIGASVICVMVDPTWGNTYALLGQHRRVSDWEAGSERWSDFGGRAHAVETDAATVAAREWLEETAGCVRLTEWDTLPQTSPAAMELALRAGDYLFALRFSRKDNGVFVTYVKQVPWDPGVVRRFTRVRGALVALQRGRQVTPPGVDLRKHPALTARGRQLLELYPARTVPLTWRERSQAVKADFLEMMSLGLWSLAQLEHAASNDGWLLTRRSSERAQLRRIMARHLPRILVELQSCVSGIRPTMLPTTGNDGVVLPPTDISA